jgi:hypothetical protein
MSENKLTGSCLCGAVHYTVSGEPERFYHCHCQRCRKVTGTGHASNLFVKGTLNWDKGEELVKYFKLPEAERFGNAFCETCGSRMPKAVPAMGFVMIPAGSLNDDPNFLPQARIFTNSRASWSCDSSEIATFTEYPS